MRYKAETIKRDAHGTYFKLTTSPRCFVCSEAVEVFLGEDPDYVKVVLTDKRTPNSVRVIPSPDPHKACYLCSGEFRKLAESNGFGSTFINHYGSPNRIDVYLGLVSWVRDTLEGWGRKTGYLKIIKS